MYAQIHCEVVGFAVDHPGVRVQPDQRSPRRCSKWACDGTEVTELATTLLTQGIIISCMACPQAQPGQSRGASWQVNLGINPNGGLISSRAAPTVACIYAERGSTSWRNDRATTCDLNHPR